MIQKVAFTPQVRFTANEAPVQYIEETPQDNKPQENSGLLLGSLAVLGAFGLGMLVRKPKVVEKTIEKTIEKATESTENKINVAKPKRKHRLEHTVPNRNPKPVSIEKQSEIVNNIETSNANASSRKLTEKAIADIPTKADIKAFGEEIRYVAPTQEEKNVINQLHFNNRQNHAGAIENNILPKEKEALNAVRNSVKNVAAKFKNGFFAHPNGNVYELKNGKIVKILDKNTQKGKVVIIDDEKKIAKHIEKHNVDYTSLTPAKTNKQRKSKLVAAA